jgi:ribonuclease HI
MTFRLYTDAAEKQGVLAWAFLVIAPGFEIQGSGLGEKNINWCEYEAIINGLKRVGDSSQVTVYTDSAYAIKQAKRAGVQAAVQKVSRECPDHRRAHHLARERLFLQLEHA